jgi:hypothetical protein
MFASRTGSWMLTEKVETLIWVDAVRDESSVELFLYVIHSMQDRLTEPSNFLEITAGFQSGSRSKLDYSTNSSNSLDVPRPIRCC